jgi:hypothetical protein
MLLIPPVISLTDVFSMTLTNKGPQLISRRLYPEKYRSLFGFGLFKASQVGSLAATFPAALIGTLLR